MTARIHTITVALEEDIREDDIQPLLTAIQQMRGVESVTTISTDDAPMHTAMARANRAWRERIYALLKETDHP